MMMGRKTIDSKIPLNNGLEMSVFGLGTYQARKGREAREAAEYALKIGYRHIDTAAIYGNEKDADVFDFQISVEDMAVLDSMDRGLRTSWDPTTVD